MQEKTESPSTPKQPATTTQIVTAPQQNNKPLQISRTQPIEDGAAWELANRIKTSSIIPKDFIGKPDNIFIAILMGREVGLAPIQAVQNIMVVNGRPCMWGDALPALVYASDKVEKFEEEIDPEGKWARCTVRRKGEAKDHIQMFTWADAVKAGYDKKQGPWQTSPKRMLQMRARAFALRDKFADVLKGLGMVEEAEDYEILNGNQPSIQMPREVVDIKSRAESFVAQEAEVVTSQESSATPTQPQAPKEDPRITTAKKKFFEEYKLPGEAIDNYLAWQKLDTFTDMYLKLQEVWKDLKSGKMTVVAEFGRCMPETQPAKEPNELPFE